MSYASIVRVHLQPGLGRLQLARLTPQQVQAFLNVKAGTGLAPRTVAYIRAVLRQALGQAERWGMVSRNVARLVEPPRVPRREVRPFSPDQARQFVDAIRGDRLEALYLVALGTGLRQGEILGLAGVPGADQRYHALLQEFRKETGPLTGATLAAACRRAPGHE